MNQSINQSSSYIFHYSQILLDDDNRFVLVVVINQSIKRLYFPLLTSFVLDDENRFVLVVVSGLAVIIFTPQRPC